MNLFKSVNEEVIEEIKEYERNIEYNINMKEKLFDRVEPIFRNMKEAFEEKKETVEVEYEIKEYKYYKYLVYRKHSNLPGEKAIKTCIALKVDVQQSEVTIYVADTEGKYLSILNEKDLNTFNNISNEELHIHFIDAYRTFIRLTF